MSRFYHESMAGMMDRELTGDGCMLGGENIDNLKVIYKDVAAAIKTVQDANKPPRAPEPAKMEFTPGSVLLMVAGGLLVAYWLGHRTRR